MTWPACSRRSAIASCIDVGRGKAGLEAESVVDDGKKIAPREQDLRLLQVPRAVFRGGREESTGGILDVDGLYFHGEHLHREIAERIDREAHTDAAATRRRSYEVTGPPISMVSPTVGSTNGAWDSRRQSNESHTVPSASSGRSK